MVVSWAARRGQGDVDDVAVASSKYSNSSLPNSTRLEAPPSPEQATVVQPRPNCESCACAYYAYIVYMMYNFINLYKDPIVQCSNHRPPGDSSIPTPSPNVHAQNNLCLVEALHLFGTVLEGLISGGRVCFRYIWYISTYLIMDFKYMWYSIKFMMII